MTDRELAVLAETHFRRTTISYPEWVKRRDAGRYTPRDGSTTEWGKGLAALDKIGVVAPPSGYGGGLPTSPVPEPTGAPHEVTTWSQLAAAVADVARPFVRITAPIAGTGDLRITRRTPFTLMGGKLIGVRVLVDGADRARVRQVEVDRSWNDAIKVTGGSSNCELDGNYVHHSAFMGINQQGGASNLHIVDNVSRHNGYTGVAPELKPSQRHGLYVGDADGFYVAGNEFDDNSGYGGQFGPNSRNGLIVCNTVRGGLARTGFIVWGTNGDRPHRFVGNLLQDAPVYEGARQRSFEVDGGIGAVEVFDTFEVNGGGRLMGDAHVERYIVGGNPKGGIDPYRHSLVRPLDRLGRPRVTADAGCLAL